jgi:hypothetical protein
LLQFACSERARPKRAACREATDRIGRGSWHEPRAQ